MKMNKLVKYFTMVAVVAIVFGGYASSSYGQTGSCVSDTAVCNESTGYQIGSNLVLAEPGGETLQNIALGYEALFSNTTGTNNTASGEVALYSNTTGSSNTAYGQNALYSNTIGGSNAATGSAALHYNTTGSYNTADGEGALFDTSTGSSNTAIGQNALKSNITGSNSIAIGYLAAFNVSGVASNNIEIGNEGSFDDGGAIRIGTKGAQTHSYIAGIYGVTLPTADQPLVCVDSAGQLGTANCATNGAPSAQQEAINRTQQELIETLQRQNETLQQQNEQFQQRIETVEKQNEDFQRRLARLEALIAKN